VVLNFVIVWFSIVVDENLMFKMFRGQIQGFTFLLFHPSQLKHLIIRETVYRKRSRSKRMWVEWQKYDSERAHNAMMAAFQETLSRPFNVERMQIISEMFGHLGNGLWVLDVGSGDGVLGEQVWKMGNHVLAVDLPTVASQAHGLEGLLAVAGDAEQLPFASNTFDVILASEIIEHLWNPNSFVDEACRLLKAAGHLIISTPEGIEGLRYDSHKNYFTVKRLTHLLNTKFTLIEVKRLKPAGTPTSTIILLFRKL
jgi:2-polyprenyl-3-methyl-5-hydroxy-6-metoxy-1,4-benzoquinol methylase